MKALVIGTFHQYQRWQDKSAASVVIRARFAEYVRETIVEREIDLVAEEAGNDEDVWAALKMEDDRISPEFRPLFAETALVEGVQPTIARMEAERAGRRHVDIRDAGAGEMTIAQRDEAMAKRTVQAAGDAASVVVIVGEAHRVGVARILSQEFGWEIENALFPKAQDG